MAGGMETIPFSAGFLMILLPSSSWAINSIEAFIKQKKLLESLKDMAYSLMTMTKTPQLNILFPQGKMIQQKASFSSVFVYFCCP
jgi:hypothetical protein